MSISKIIVHASCDECAAPFKVELDPATRTHGADIFFYAEDAIRGGALYFAPGERVTLQSCSVQGDKHLCPDCTEEADKEGDDAEA